MATGSFGGQLQSAISSRLTADPYEKRRQAAMGSYQDQAEKSRKDLSERLNRLGVLRGGGATASQFGEFESGVLRGQQSLDAQFEAQREAGVGQAIQQGLGLYGTDQQFGLAGRQQTEAERMGQFSRDLGTREFMSQDALRRDQQRESERSALAQEGMQRGALTGLYDGQRTLDQQRQDLAYRTGLAQTFGTDLGGDDTTRQTEARSQRLQQEAFQRAGLTGALGDDRTLAAQQLYGSPEATTTLQGQELALRRGELLGKIDQERTLAAQEALGTVDNQDTLARDALQQQKDEAALDRTATEDQAGLNRDLARAELRGFEEIDGRRVQTLAAREAGAQRRLTESQAKLDRDARTTEAGLQRDLAREELYGGYTTEYDRQMGRVGTLAKTEGAAERQARADLQQAQFGQETSQAALQRSLAREELYGGVTTDYERAMGAKTLASSGQAADIAAEIRRLDEMETSGASQREIALAQQAEIERSALIREGFEGRRVGVAEQTRRDQVAQERQRMALAEQELYGGAEEITLDNLELDPALEMGAGRNAAVRQALQQRLGREPSQDEVAAITGGNSIRGRQTLAAQEAGEGRTFAAEQAALDRGLTRGESELARGLSREELAQRGEQADLQRGLAREELYGYSEDASGRRQQTLGARESQAQRGIQERELAQRGELAGAELLSREGLARDQRSLDREALYGTGDVRRQGGATLAATQAAQDMSLRRELGRGQLAQDSRRTDLSEAELRGYTEDASGRREQTEGARAERARTATQREDLALRGELGRGQLAQDTRRTDLARDELRGYSELYPGGMREDTAAVREGKAARALTSREAEAGRDFESGERALDRREASNQASQARLLAREELYGTSDPYSQTGATLQGRLAAEETSRYEAATTLEAERYDTQRGDFAADIRRRDEQDELQKQFEGLAAGRAMDAARLADSNYEASPQEQAVVDYLLRGGKGEIRQYLTKSQVDALTSRGFTEDEIYAIEGGADPQGILAARE